MKEPSSATPALAITVVIFPVGESFRALRKNSHCEAYDVTSRGKKWTLFRVQESQQNISDLLFSPKGQISSFAREAALCARKQVSCAETNIL